MSENKKNGLRNQHGITCDKCGQFVKIPMDSLGGRLHFLRNGKGLTLRGLATELGIAPTTVMRIEKNEEPRLDRLKLIAEYFGVGLDSLVYGNKKEE